MNWILPRIIGHRGAMAFAPENTLLSFRTAKMLGASWVEFDVKKTKDNLLVVFHDETLDRLTQTEGKIIEKTYDEIRHLRIWHKHYSQKIPTLEETMMLLARLKLGANIEIKPCSKTDVTYLSELSELVVKKIQSSMSSYLPPPLISSFDIQILRKCRQLDPKLRIGYLMEEIPDDLEKRVSELKCQTLHVDETVLTPKNMKRLSSLPIVAYTVNCPKRAQELFDQGVTSIITDRLFKIHEAT